MAVGGPSALLVPQRTKWGLDFFSRPPISVSPSRREIRLPEVRTATGGANPARLAISAAVRPDAKIVVHSFVSSVKTHFLESFVSRPPAELGLFSLLFVLSMVLSVRGEIGIRVLVGRQAMGAFVSLAVISLPTMNAFRKLAVSMEELSKVASVEVPGTLSSLKLSGLEINDLTQQLNGLRQRLTGKKRRKQQAASRRNEDSIMY
ncbi:unnamed protein product [Victoria cruziana]